ncbi:MAG: GNAT family N-acetyltransferase [Pseudonocardia sp.]
MDHRFPETLHGPRVTLRRRLPAHTPAVHALVRDALAHLRPWMSWATEDYDLASAAANAAAGDEAWQRGTGFAYLVEAAGVPVGTCELRRMPCGMELGYWLHPAHTGRGLVTEAARLLVDEALAAPDVACVEIWHDAANLASAGVPRRLGFTEVARRTPPREPLTPGEIGIDVLWRLTRPA